MVLRHMSYTVAWWENPYFGIQQNNCYNIPIAVIPSFFFIPFYRLDPYFIIK